MSATWQMIEKYQVTWQDIESLGLTWGELDNLSEDAIIDIAKQRIERFKNSDEPIKKENVPLVRQACQIAREKEPAFIKKAVSALAIHLLEKIVDMAIENRYAIMAAIIKLVSSLHD